MKLIAFDWDQTLWNSWEDHVKAAQYAAALVDVPEPSEQWIASSFSVPFARHLELIFPHRTPEATTHYLDFYHSRIAEMGRLFDGVPELLEELKSEGYLVALLSDKREVYGSQELESTGISGLFDCVLFLNDGRAYKPSPQGLCHVMETLAVKKEEVLYVGDSYVDVQCAKKAGVTSGAALWGCVNVEAVLDEGPDLVVNSVPEVLTSLTMRIPPF